MLSYLYNFIVNVNKKHKFLAEEKFNFMNGKIIAAGNDVLAMEIKRLIIDTDLKTMRKRMTRT